MTHKLLVILPWTIAVSLLGACSHHAHEPSSIQTSLTDSSDQVALDSHPHPQVASNDHNQGHNAHGHHSHAPLAIPENVAAPTVDLLVSEDAIAGWNLELQVTNFEFTPEKVNQSSVFNEGHAHLYINDQKMGRLYGPWHHLATLEPGENTIMVTLNANGHEALQVDGQTVSDTSVIVVPQL